MGYQLHGVDPDSSVFRNKDEGYGLSVTLWESSRDWDDVCRGHEGAGITTLVVGDVRSLGVIVARAPLVGNLNHCELFNIGAKTPKKLKRVHAWALHHPSIEASLRGAEVTFQKSWKLRSITVP